MGEACNETLVTEFGRTARINGNAGTGHGTATVALLAGGALKGGRIVADWPGVIATKFCSAAKCRFGPGADVHRTFAKSEQSTQMRGLRHVQTRAINSAFK